MNLKNVYIVNLFVLQPDSPEYKAACKLWELYLRTKNEFVQKGDADEEDEDEEGHDHQGTELVSVVMTAAAEGSHGSVCQLTLRRSLASIFGKAFNLFIVKLRSKRYFLHKFSSYWLIISQHRVYVTFLSSKKKK